MTAADAVGLGEGERRKADAFACLERRREAVIRRARRVLLERVLCVGQVTIDHVRGLVAVPAGVNPKCFGPVPLPLARARIIRQAGSARTKRPEGHARPVTVWELADPMAAERWLAAHPDLPDAPDADQDGPPMQGVLFPLKPRNQPTPAGTTAGAGN